MSRTVSKSPPITVLLVHKMPHLREKIGEGLTQAGYNVYETDSEVSANGLLTSGAELINVVLSEHCPSSGGINVLSLDSSTPN